jgi:Uma2 family endonuclease
MPATLKLETWADKLHALGDVPAERVIWLGREATEADLLRMIEGEPKRLVELIDGFLVEKAAGFHEGMLAVWIGTCLNNFVVPRRLGLVGGADEPMRLLPGVIRLPDVCFVSWARLPTPNAHRRPVARFAPDLAVEVLSRRNRRREIARKRREFFTAGTRLMWVVDPRRRTVAVYTDPDTHTILSGGDTVAGGDVLPGFAISLTDLFGYLEQLPFDAP